MQKVSNIAELKASIRELELKTQRQEQALKDNAKSTVQNFRPVNLIKNGLVGAKKVAVRRDIRVTALNTFVGLAAGFLSRKLVVGKSRNIFKRTLGAAVQAGITKFVYKKLPGLQQTTIRLLSKSNQRKKRRPL